MADASTFDGGQNIIIQPELDKSGSSTETEDFYVVGIGASAGGLEALEQFFANMPPASNMAFVVIQHLSPDFKSLMPEILSRNTEMKVYQIEKGMKIVPGCVYLNPPKFTVEVSRNQFLLSEQNQIKKVNLTINTFFESLAEDMNEKSIGIILSGTGSDGTRGCRAIKEAGGIVIAQDVKTAKFNGMPKSVIATNICDFILSPSSMPEKLLKYINQSWLMNVIEDEEQKSDEATDILSQIYNLIKNLYATDFSLYKQSTVLRCLNRRIRICQIQTLEEYLSYLKETPEEIECLYNSLLIGVTRFFRDSNAFDVMKNKVIPEIIDRKTDNAVVRVWVAGCSTGEEAYSIAILFKEHMDYTQRNITVKVFATDIDIKSIEYASKGVYPDSIAEDVSLERLNRYFIKKRDGYHVSKFIREMVIFSSHNVINNPPFYKIDLLTCRNLLIYFQPSLQKRIISTFQFALETNGFMFLGTSETTGEMDKYFSTFDAKWKIYKRNNIKKRPPVEDFSGISTDIKVIQSKPEEDYFTGVERNKWEMEGIQTILIEECLPPSVLLDENGELVQICGDVDKYLKVPRGRVCYDIQKMVPKELSTALGTAISKVRKERKTVAYSNIKVKLAQEENNINLVVKPLFTKKSGLLIYVIFEEIQSSGSHEDYVENFDTVGELHSRIADLEQELQYTKESLQSTIEELETSSEELQSANEELLVSNEEMHSTNEELQSVNEELMVVNTQYEYKIQELADLNNDMTNFLNSTDIGTLFLDSNLCVRKFTPAIAREINLIEQDIGRPISHISHNFKNEDLIEVCRDVMDNLVPVEKEIKSLSNKWYILKYSPFRTNENAIKGIVTSLVDITARKEAEENQRKSKEELKEAIALDDLKNDFFSNLSHELRTPLNVIMSTLQLLESQRKSIGTKDGSDKREKYFNIIKQNCYRQLRLVNNMIDSTKIDAGFFEIHQKNYNIVNIVENIALSVSDYIKNKGIGLIFDTDVEEKITACDLDSIERIILNLLSNAVKFTDQGGSINLNIKDKGATILISVKDSGIGISKDKQKIIFERFRQVDKSLARRHEGSGIGLSLVKSLVVMHAGKISVQSEYGKGTEFLIEIPVKTVPEDSNIIKAEVKQQNNVEKINIEFSDIYKLQKQ
ncbi:MCP methyltransferase/methylesterase, CheR/CheB with PAS/PAC sensor [Clostridium aceticum]|uniref:MCP methyltransferase/methylesterase, CheR/CheB with PAS/PAC sensor n=1 Tax=Clostridium aceticum TaxID=84022 RepID=A0A0G3WDV7_9CLOT|nr:chemotaxis protein CheB [Clostridium aceticum]AKL96538.1 MCP methyltransferase/methylesterase, CheR/CheB with PAS/PAC sensor [Clostridium aceticum]